MTHSVTKFPQSVITEAAVGGGFSILPWSNPELAKTMDGFYATNGYASLDIGGTTDWLYAKEFGFEIPAGSVIEGISVEIKKYGIGTISDQSFYLVYRKQGNPWGTFPSTPHSGTWSSTPTVDTYGSSTYLWPNESHVWTAEEINDEIFGPVIRATAASSVNVKSANIEYFSVTVYYHLNETITVSGGCQCGGSASVNETDTFIPVSAGVVCAGHSAETSNIDGSGGAVCAGLAPNQASIPMYGGCQVAGDGLFMATYLGTMGSTSVSVTANGIKNIPPDLVHSDVATCNFTYDMASNRLYWDIRHNIVGLDIVHLNGPALKNQTAGTQIDIDNLSSLTSPIIGSAVLTGSQEVQLTGGTWYVQFRETSSSTNLRAQLDQSKSFAGGDGVYGTQYDHVVTGGLVCAGSVVPRLRYNPVPTGGVVCDGLVNTVLSIAVSGGCRVGGSAVESFFKTPTISGGCTVSGTSIPDCTYTFVVTTEILVGGSGIIGIQPPVSGGCLVDGSADSLHLVIPGVSGGCLVYPSHIKQQIYAPQPTDGGVRCRGRATNEKLKFFSGAKRNYGGAMGSTNLLTVDTSTTTKLIDPIGAVSPILDSYRFRMKHSSDWCDVGECVDGVLTKVIQVRQNGILPPKKASVVEDYI